MGLSRSLLRTCNLERSRSAAAFYVVSRQGSGVGALGEGPDTVLRGSATPTTLGKLGKEGPAVIRAAVAN